MKKKFLILMSVIVFGVGVVVVTTEAQRLNYNQGYEPEQPVKYNHKLHAGDYQIPCLYCHFAFLYHHTAYNYIFAFICIF